MGFDLGNLLQQYLGGANDVNHAQASSDFDRVAQTAPRADVAQGVTQALRSDQTPPFGNMVEHLFNNGSPDQRAGMLNQLITNVAPAVLSRIAGGALGNLSGADQARISPEQASQVSPSAVRELAEQAQQQYPGMVERMGDFYADHPNPGHAASLNKDNFMGMLSDIFHKIFPAHHPAATPGTALVSPQAPQAGGAPAQPVDVEQILTTMQQQSRQPLNWRTSIVDLLKLLNLDCSLQARKELASELHYTGDTNDSASMNIWLHKQVMTKLAENGGNVPADLQG